MTNEVSHGRGEAKKRSSSKRTVPVRLGNPKSRHGRTRIECDTATELDMKTLIWTRGANFPLELLESRLRCPRCGKLGVTVLFAVPGQPKPQAIHAAE